MAEAVGSLVTSSHTNPTAAQLAQLLNSKGAVAYVGTAAAEATLQAAAALAPTAVKPLKLSGGMLAVEAAASLSGSSEQVTGQQQQQQQQQHLSRAITSKASRLQSPQGNRSSRGGSLSPTVRSQQQRIQQSEQQQQQPGQPGLPDLASPRSSAGPGFSQADAAAAGNSRRNTGTLGSYAALTVDTGAERPASSGAGVSGAAGGAAGSPGGMQSSRRDGRSSPATTPSAAQMGPQLQELAPGAQRQQPAQQQQPALPPSASPERSRLHSSSRCSSPMPLLAPGTPQGHTAAGSPPPSASARSRDGSPSHTTIDDRRSRQDSMSGRAAPAAEAVRASTPESLLHTNSRLSSTSGQSCTSSRLQQQQQQQQRQSPQQQPPEEQGQQLEAYTGDDDTQCPDSSKTSSDTGGRLTNVYGLSLSAAICVADLVRQVWRGGFGGLASS
jgi:hypothetical protein